MNSDSRSILQCSVDQPIYGAGMSGAAWRVLSGVVRLDTTDNHGESSFANLAVAGDIIGCEAMLLGSYTFSAMALTQCELAPWPEGVPSGVSLMESLAQAQRRAAELLALRAGQASDRVIGLIRLLANSAGSVVLPSRRDIADITSLRLETISRIIKNLERARVISPLRIKGVHAARAYCLSPELVGIS